MAAGSPTWWRDGSGLCYSCRWSSVSHCFCEIEAKVTNRIVMWPLIHTEINLSIKKSTSVSANGVRDSSLYSKVCETGTHTYTFAMFTPHTEDYLENLPDCISPLYDWFKLISFRGRGCKSSQYKKVLALLMCIYTRVHASNAVQTHIYVCLRRYPVCPWIHHLMAATFCWIIFQ